MPIKRVSTAFSRLQQKVKDLQNRFQKISDEDPAEELVELPSETGVQKVLVEISLWSATKILLLVAGFYLAFAFLERITSILILLFVSVFFATALNPGVDRMEKAGVPRGVGVILLMIVVISVFLGILGGVIPIIGGEVAKMWEGLTEFARKLSQEDFSTLPLWLQNSIEDVIPIVRDYINQISPSELQSAITNFARDNLGASLGQFGTVAGKGLGFIFAIFGGIFQTLLVIILTFFLVVEKGNIGRFFVRLFPKKYERYILQKAGAVQRKVGEWVHGQIILFAIIALIAYIGLTILGIEYALTLALIAGLAEFIPYVGPFIAFASAAPVAFNDSLSIGIATMLFYVGIQMVEGNILVPLVMKKAVGISPIVTIIAMLIGWEFLGIMGMILAVPVASVLSLFIDDYSPHGRRKTSKNQKALPFQKKIEE